MKKPSMFALLAVLVVLLTASCGRRELKNMRGLVVGLESVGDSITGMRVLSGSDTLIFKLADAQFNNGLSIPGDSVILDYIEGRRDTLRALVVTILPKSQSGNTIDLSHPDSSAELVTAPDSTSKN